MRHIEIAIATAFFSLLFATFLPAAAQITSVNPRTGVAADSLGRGGTVLTVSGTALAEGMSLRLSAGGVEKALLGLTFDSRAQTYSGRIPFLPAGRYDLKLYTPCRSRSAATAIARSTTSRPSGSSSSSTGATRR